MRLVEREELPLRMLDVSEIGDGVTPQGWFYGLREAEAVVAVQLVPLAEMASRNGDPQALLNLRIQ